MKRKVKENGQSFYTLLWKSLLCIKNKDEMNRSFKNIYSEPYKLKKTI